MFCKQLEALCYQITLLFLYRS